MNLPDAAQNNLVNDIPKTVAALTRFQEYAPPDGWYATGMSLQLEAITYLVYKPAGGIWIGLASLSWEVSGAAEYAGLFAENGGLPNDYLNSSNWNVNWMSPTLPQTLSDADFQTRLISWNDYASHYISDNPRA
ncbi:MAG: hypothetical protein U0800_19640 [Isosphaeraceae bacterium]